MKSRIVLFTALVGTMLLAGCRRCCKAKPKVTPAENALGSLGSTKKAVESSKEDLELPAADVETSSN